MPGKRPNDNGYSHVSGMKLYREVTASEGSLANVPVLDLSVQERKDPSGRDLGISNGADNRLILGVLLGNGTSSCDIVVYVDMYPNDTVLEDEADDWEGRWAVVATLSATYSKSITLDGIYPGRVKVLVAGMTGPRAYIVYSRTE